MGVRPIGATCFHATRLQLRKASLGKSENRNMNRQQKGPACGPFGLVSGSDYAAAALTLREFSSLPPIKHLKIRNDLQRELYHVPVYLRKEIRFACTSLEQQP